MNDHWDCPSCGRPTPPEIDVECNCGMKSSHHLSVSAMCRIMHNMSEREAALIIRNKKLQDEVNEQARLLGMSGERECDLRGERDRMKGLLIRLYNDLFVTHGGTAVSDLKEMFREENYN